MVRGAFSSLAFPLPSSRPSHGSYHLSSSLAKKDTVHMLFMIALSWKTMKFCKLQLFESKIPCTLLLYARETSTSQRCALTGKEWPTSPILAEDLTLLCLLLWLTPTALRLGLTHKYVHTLSVCVCLCYRFI